MVSSFPGMLITSWRLLFLPCIKHHLWNVFSRTVDNRGTPIVAEGFSKGTVVPEHKPFPSPGIPARTGSSSAFPPAVRPQTSESDSALSSSIQAVLHARRVV